MILRSLLLFTLMVCGTAHAKRFRNAYVSFELPPNWNCKLEGSEWVCENEFSNKTKEAIIILTAKERMISNQMWIDGMHLGSEVGPYFTRYLATIKDKIAILVTFSAHKEQYTKYSADFIKAIESLRVVATKDSLGDRGGGVGFGPGVGETIGAPIGQSMSPYTSDTLPEE